MLRVLEQRMLKSAAGPKVGLVRFARKADRAQYRLRVCIRAARCAPKSIELIQRLVHPSGELSGGEPPPANFHRKLPGHEWQGSGYRPMRQDAVAKITD